MPMREGDCTMILLQISDKGRGLYLKDDKLVSISGIEPNDLVALVEVVAVSEEAVELDKCSDKRPIVNPIEKVIYEEVYKVLSDLATNREAYLTECEDKLTELEKKYGLEGLRARQR